MATKCLDYLNLSTLASPTSTAVINGDYGFVDYAAIYWVRHIEAGLSGMNEHVEHDKHLNSLAESLENFLRQHYTTPTHPLPVSQRNRDKLAWFEDFEFFEDFLRSVVSTRKQITFFGKMKKGEIALDISEMASSIRKILEETYASAPEETVTGNLTEKYGDSIFKCPRFSCKYFNAGFASLEDRNRHCDKHDRPFRCTETACMNYHIGFATTGDLDKHMRETHSSVSQDEFPTDQDVQQSMLPEPVQQEPAPAPVVEVTQRAPEPEPEPDPEPEPQPDSDPEPILHPLPAQHRTRRKEKRRDFICNHCGKVFQKKYNWTSHLLTHSTSKPFKCKHCDKSFVRACDMRRHEGTHGEKKHVCAGCGQKFARADILKSHHKTRVGQLCIRPRVQMTTGQVEPGPSTEGSRSSSSG